MPGHSLEFLCEKGKQDAGRLGDAPGAGAVPTGSNGDITGPLPVLGVLD